MAALVWDQIGERIYQTGIDHGVLYLQDGTVAALEWSHRSGGISNSEVEIVLSRWSKVFGESYLREIL